MSKSTIVLDGNSLSITDLVAIARDDATVQISEKACEKIVKSAEIVQYILKEKIRVYGVTTGFGFMQGTTISTQDAEKLQRNLVISHAAGVGPEFSQEIVRGMMVLEINKFARGHSGIRLKVVTLLSDLLNNQISPVVPSRGSLGASGDLAPLAHLSLVLIGKGNAYHNKTLMLGSQALDKAGLLPIRLIAKEGLALLNGTQAMTSVAALAVADAANIIRIANIAAAMNMEVHQANVDALNPLIHEARPHAGQSNIALSLRELLRGSKRIQEHVPNQDCYSLRCVPAVHGATLDTITYVKKVVETEMNSSTDNPLLFSKDDILSGGNFHGQPIALVMDFLGIALAELGNISERRLERLLNPVHSGLPAFLTSHGGLNSGLMIMQYTAASLVSENKSLAFPASVDSIPVSANQEDHVSMGSVAAMQTWQILEHLHHIFSIELICVAQAIDLARIQDQIAPALLNIYQNIRKVIPVLSEDRELAPDIQKCVELIRKRVL
ncbi:MAG: histidine ammonia-lyase [Candidatus Hodarchaeales archaeon]